MSKEIAYSEPSYLYTGKDFEKYNPDSLIGRKGYAIYKRMMLDEQVKAVVKFRTDSILSRGFYFDIDDDGITKAQRDERIAVSEKIVEEVSGSWTDKMKGVMSAMYNGFSMTEIITRLIEVDKKKWVGLENLKLRPFDTFNFKVDPHGNIKAIVQKVSGKEIKINPKQFIHFVGNPDIDEHYGESELRSAYRAWFSKDYAIKFRNIWLERHAGGFRYIQPTIGASLNPNSPEYLAVQRLLSSVDTSTGAILPPNLNYNSEYPANNVAYKEAIDDYNFAIAIALLVPNLVGITPQTQTGSYSQSEVQVEAYLDTLKADIDRLEDALNEQLFRRLGEKNWGDGKYPKIRFNKMTRAQTIKLISVFNELVGKSALTPTIDDQIHIRDALDFPAMTDEDIEEAKQKQVEPDDKEIENEDDSKKEGEKGEPQQEETVMGKGTVKITTFSKAEKRVDFAVIEKTSDSIVNEYSTKLSRTMDSIVVDLVEKSMGKGEVKDVSDNLKSVSTDSKLKQKLNRAATSMLKEGTLLGAKHASFEVDKALKKEFRADYNRLDFISDDYLKTTAFKIAGNLTSEAESLIETAILNGARYGKSWDEVEEDVYQTFATKGMISQEQAQIALGEALNVENPDARLRTITRTSTFDAINNARHAYFTDPKLDDFVQAFEYSAILDSRTTDICRHLDADSGGRGNHTVEWYNKNPEYRPPNHFNCRSLLIPVTKVDMDDFEEGKEPRIKPQQGFR